MRQELARIDDLRVEKPVCRTGTQIHAKITKAAGAWEHIAAMLVELRKTLVTGDMVAAHWDLLLSAEDLGTMAAALQSEHKMLQSLVDTNFALARQIDIACGEVRFLAAIVSHAKVELASLSHTSGGLDGFADALESLSANAKVTLSDYKSKQNNLRDLLRQANEMHLSFEKSHAAKLKNSAEDLKISCSELTKIKENIESYAKTTSRSVDCAVDLFHGILELDVLGTEESNLQDKIRSLSNTTGQITASADDDDTASNRFLIKLGPKLSSAKTLIEDCKQSRLDLETVAAKVSPTFRSLNSLTENVANVVADMTIVGTNAMVKAHRLGQGGAGLSVIAQHLRSHALKVADEIKRFGPFLQTAARLTDEFSMSSESQDARRFDELGSRMTSVVSSISLIDELAMKLRSEISLRRTELSVIVSEVMTS